MLIGRHRRKLRAVALAELAYGAQHAVVLVHCRYDMSAAPRSAENRRVQRVRAIQPEYNLVRADELANGFSALVDDCGGFDRGGVTASARVGAQRF